MKVKIISDSTCDLPKDIVEKLDIKIMPLVVSLGEKSYNDGIDITPEDIYSYVSESGNLPKTSALNIGVYESEFKTWTDAGYDVVHISISSGFSCSYQNALIASEDFDNVYVIIKNIHSCFDKLNSFNNVLQLSKK